MVGGGEENAEAVILPLEAMNFCMRPLGARIAFVAVGLDKFVVDKLLVIPLEGGGARAKEGTGEAGLRGEGLLLGASEGELRLWILGEGEEEVEELRFQELSIWLMSLKSDMRVTYQKKMGGQGCILEVAMRCWTSLGSCFTMPEGRVVT